LLTLGGLTNPNLQQCVNGLGYNNQKTADFLLYLIRNATLLLRGLNISVPFELACSTGGIKYNCFRNILKTPSDEFCICKLPNEIRSLYFAPKTVK
jgi:hypothetical protein